MQLSSYCLTWKLCHMEKSVLRKVCEGTRLWVAEGLLRVRTAAQEIRKDMDAVCEA